MFVDKFTMAQNVRAQEQGDLIEGFGNFTVFLDDEILNFYYKRFI